MVTAVAIGITISPIVIAISLHREKIPAKELIHNWIN